MKPLREISGRQLTVGFSGWLLATNLLVWLAHATNWWLVKTVLFMCLVMLPGAALLRLLRIRLKTTSAWVLYSFGLSLLVLMLSGLAANQILPTLGVVRPLRFLGALGTWDLVTAVIIVAGSFVNSRAVSLTRQRAQGFSGPAWLLLMLSVLLPAGAVAGAFRLNNGGDGLVAVLTLCYAAALIIYAFLLRRHLPDGLLAWFMFILGLSVLLMTSLRGWDIFGHDIEREFRVYTLTHTHAYWDFSLNRDPYNACLSITILPEMFAKILGVSGLVVFKVILQVVFAACPAVLYVLLRQYVSKLGALTGAMLFICYPTFINDSAMLTRQGVAYLFFALALLVISNKTLKKRYKQLFLLCALGAVLSHYSTTYMFVALFSLAVLCKLVICLWQRQKFRVWGRRLPPSVVSPLYAGLLFLMAFVWYTQVTTTSGGLATTLRASVANIPRLFTEDNKSSDTSVALLFSGNKTAVDVYQGYLGSTPAHTAPSTAIGVKYVPMLTSDDLPLTQLGRAMRRAGIDPSLITALRQNFAKFLQLLALVGVIYAVFILFRKRSGIASVDALFRKRPDALGIDFVCLSLAGLLLLGLMVILPVLSINYGVLRAFQQALIILVLPIIILLARLNRPIWAGVRTAAATVSVVGLFLLFTGAIAQLLGGTSPSPSMNNRGLYIGLYYSPEADSRAFAWLKTSVPKSSDVRAANFNRARMHDPDYPFAQSGILPLQLGLNSYVYLDQAQVVSKKIYAYYESSPLIMTFPLDYYDDTKNEIYSTTTTRIYQ